MKKSTATASPIPPVKQIAEAGKPKRAAKTAVAPEAKSNLNKTKEVKSLTEINAQVTPDATPITMPAAPATVKPAAKPATKSSAAKAAPKIAAVADDATPASAAPTMADLVREAARAHRAEEAAGGGKPKAAPKPAPKPAVVAKPAAPPVSATAPIEATPGELSKKVSSAYFMLGEGSISDRKS